MNFPDELLLILESFKVPSVTFTLPFQESPSSRATSPPETFSVPFLVIFIVASDSIVPAETVKSLVVVLLPIFKVPAEMISLALSKSKPVPSTSVLPPV